MSKYVCFNIFALKKIYIYIYQKVSLANTIVHGVPYKGTNDTDLKMLFYHLRANFIELLSREFCLANIFAKHYKTDYQPK